MDPNTAQQTPVSSTPAAPTAPTTPVEAATPNPSQPASSSPTPTPAASVAGAPVQSASGSVTPSDPEVKKSSNKMWVIMVLIILVILAVAGWFLYSYSMTKSTNSMYPAVSPTAVPSPTVGAVQSGDKQIDQQSQTIDENMIKVNEDVKGVDSGLNAKPENLGY